MAVKRSSSATRMLAVFEAIARSQPVGVSALARGLEADKSAVQRDLMTLADAGWIRPAPVLAGQGAGQGTGQWELSPHILTLARPPHSADALRLRAQPILEELRRETGETAYLAVPHGDRYVVLSAAESHHALRVVPAVGIVIAMEGSATGRAVAPYREGAADDAAHSAIRALGYAVNDEDVHAGAVAMASAVLDAGGRPVGSLVLTGPAERLPPERRAAMGTRLRDAARRLAAELS